MTRFRFLLLCTVATGAQAFLRGADASPAAPVPMAATASSHIIRDLTYATLPGTELKLDLYLPLEKGGRPRALLVWIHGGGWREGGRGFCPISPLVKEGYAVASLSYRLTQDARFPAQIEDCKAAIRWLRAHATDYHFDGARIGVCGESAGGLLAALLGTSGGIPELEGTEGNPGVSSRVQAVVALCPPTDLTRDDDEQALVPELLQSANPQDVVRGRTIQSRGSILVAALGGPLAEHRELARTMSPVTYVTSDDPPFLLVHGDRDHLVPIIQSEQFAGVLKKVGIEVTLVVVPGAGHGFGRPSATLMQKIKGFFDAHL